MLNPRLNRQALSRRALVLAAAALLTVAVPVAALRGTQAAGPLIGSIFDPSGAVMPAVEVALEADGGQGRWQVRTDASGRFVFENVQPGRYVLAASVPGFRPLRYDLDLRAKSDWDRVITLQVGDLRETVTVSASRMAAAAPSRPTGPAPLRVGGNIKAPRKELDVKPIYPISMRQAGREGIVLIDAVIGRDGAVTSVRVLSAQIHPDFAIAAIDAVRQWRFTPTLLNGVPVDVVMTVSVEFQLADK